MSAYRLLLLLYPPAFRRKYGAEMTEAFERLAEHTRRERGRAALALLWARAAVGGETVQPGDAGGRA